MPSRKVVFGRLVAGSTPAVAAGTNGANVWPSSLEWLTYSVAGDGLPFCGKEAKAMYSVAAASIEGEMYVLEGAVWLGAVIVTALEEAVPRSRETAIRAF